jgi:hypothetical protein
MKSRQRRVRAIELSLTPQQVVVVWLRNAHAGTIEEGARHSPPYRGAIANEVLRTVRNGMKGQPETLIERAVMQGRQDADLLFNLVVNANSDVMANSAHREREYVLLLGFLSAEMRAGLTKHKVEILRLLFLNFIETVIVLDAAIAQIGSERLGGQPVLFRDTSVILAEQLQMASDLSKWFNEAAVSVGVAQIDLEKLRDSLQSEIDRQISICFHLARVQALDLFGDETKRHAAMERAFLFLKSNCGEASDNFAHGVTQ